MSHPPQTPVKVPASAASYTPATLDPDLRSQINMMLLREGHINKIQELLLHSLNSHSSNWPSAVQQHALTLLRSGDVATFPALVRRVLEDVRHDTAATTTTTDGSSSSEANGAAATNGSKPGGGGGGTTNGATTTAAGDGSLALPQAVVDAVLKVTRECLESVCEIDDASAAG
ncbi:hypothetical protein F4804DRAFT_221393 [Jackrogersella minutella]|nr:hypothetical protein F4804DRAFT_221393 [Jackrogersella minutella]